jgi:hypothetical protein
MNNTHLPQGSAAHCSGLSSLHSNQDNTADDIQQLSNVSFTNIKSIRQLCSASKRMICCQHTQTYKLNKHTPSSNYPAAEL